MKVYIRGYESQASANNEIVDYWFVLAPRGVSK